MSAEKLRGVGDRLKKGSARELIDTAYSFELKDKDYLYDGMSQADIAHVLMLLEENLIPKDAGKILLSELLIMNEQTPGELNFDPKYGDTYTNREQVLKSRIGNNTGWLHIGRARRECSTLGFIIASRKKMLEFSNSVVSLSRSIIEQAGNNVESVMPDFTYFQHAHPTTLGHYLLTFEYPLLRDMERIKEAYSRLNMSPAGSGSTNGSRYPLNRERLSELLGFPQFSIHARDAMWRPDIAVELSSLVVIVALNIDRLVEELQIWTTAEFDMIDLSDEFCRTSVIMPQKKNPYGLSYFRGLVGLLIGRMAGTSSIQKTFSGQPDSRIFPYGEIPESLTLITDGLKLIAQTIQTMQVNKSVLKKRAHEGFTGATDLAEVIMDRYAVDYGTAHRIVGAAVRYATENNFKKLDADILNQAASELNIAINLTQIELEETIDPEKIITTRKGPGAASVERVSEMLKECEEKTDKMLNWIESEEKNIKEAYNNLLKTAGDLLV